MQYKDFPPLFRLFHLFSILRNKRTTKQEKVFSGFPDVIEAILVKEGILVVFLFDLQVIILYVLHV